jgi:hypothetical protein
VSEFYWNSSSLDQRAIVTRADFERKEKIETYLLFELLNRPGLTDHTRRAMAAILRK